MKSLKNLIMPSRSQSLEQFIISKLIDGAILGIGLAVGNALALIIEKRYFPDLAREIQQEQKA